MANVADRKKKKKKRGLIARKLFQKKKPVSNKKKIILLGLITLGIAILIYVLLKKRRKTKDGFHRQEEQNQKKKDNETQGGTPAGAEKQQGSEKGKTESKKDSRKTRKEKKPKEKKHKEKKPKEKKHKEKKPKQKTPKAAKNKSNTSGKKNEKPGNSKAAGAEKALKKKPVKLQKVDFFIIAAITAGIGLLIYPSIGDLYSRWQTMQSINEYDTIVDEMDDKEIEDEIERARRYNRTLWGTRYLGIGEDEPDGSNLMKEGDEVYNDILNVTNNGVMGYVIIDKIDSYSTLYHGSTESVLAAGVGHLFSTGFTVDGPNVHGAISAHTGLVSATLFTDLDQLEIGDSFEIHVLNRVFTYQIDQIRIVDPSDLSDLQIEYGSNLVTLITCYPYGINSHRLLVRGRLQGYNYNREDYEEYITDEGEFDNNHNKDDVQDSQTVEDWQGNGGNELTQTGTLWTDILSLVIAGAVIAGMAGLFYLHFKGKKAKTYTIQKNICVIVCMAGMLLMLIAAYQSVKSLKKEYDVGMKCHEQMRNLKNYFAHHDGTQDSEATDTDADTTEEETEQETEAETEPDTEPESETKNNPSIMIGENRYIGELSLPSLDLELPVLAECTEENLDIAPCVDIGTIEGRNLVIAGHRYRKIFSNLEKLRPGDEIYLTSAENKFYTYVVRSCAEIIPRKEDLYYGYQNWDMVLYTCSASGKYRYVVYAELMEE